MRPSISTGLLAAQSDQRLVDLVRRGHKRAFEVLVQRYRRPLLRYCGRMGLADVRAEDVLQHSLLQAWLALERGVEVRDPRPWLYRIVHNAAVNHMRSSRNDHSLLADLTSLRASSTPAESELERRSAVRDTLTDVAALPRMQREAILLSAVAGHSHDEVADVLGVTDGAVRGLLYRARATLRTAAAVFTPQPLINWACSVGAPGPAAERLAELSAPVGAAGMTGVLLKGAAAAVTTAVLVGGAAVVPLQRQAGHRTRSVPPSVRVSSTLPAVVATSEAGSPSSAPGVASTGATLSASTGVTRRLGGARTNGSGTDTRSQAVSSFGSPSDRGSSQDGRGSDEHAEILDSERPASRRGSHVNSPAAGGSDGSGSGASAQGSGDAVRAQQGASETSSGAPSGSDGSGGSGRTAPTPTAGGDEAAQPATVPVIAPSMPAAAHTSD
jgi:RNA polymerase sigma factor (sigma-70 family)